MELKRKSILYRTCDSHFVAFLQGLVQSLETVFKEILRIVYVQTANRIRNWKIDIGDTSEKEFI